MGGTGFMVGSIGGGQFLERKRRGEEKREKEVVESSASWWLILVVAGSEEVCRSWPIRDREEREKRVGGILVAGRKKREKKETDCNGVGSLVNDEWR